MALSKYITAGILFQRITNHNAVTTTGGLETSVVLVVMCNNMNSVMYQSQGYIIVI